RHGGRAGAASGRQAPATLGAAAGQDLAAVGGLHAGTEAVVALALEVAGLESALGGHLGSSRAGRPNGRAALNEPEILALGPDPRQPAPAAGCAPPGGGGRLPGPFPPASRQAP